MFERFEARRQPTVTSNEYLFYLKQQFGLRTIFYPGSNDDDTLREVFGDKNAYYLDKREEVQREPTENMEWGSYGFIVPRIPDRRFDALFLQDNHAEEKEVRQMVAKVRVGGVVIHSSDDCGPFDNVQSDQLERFAGLQPLSLPMWHRYFTAFRRVPLKPRR